MSDIFHDDYAGARRHFQTAAAAAGFTLEALVLDERGPDGEELAIDVAIKANGPIRAAVVVSSGTHGVEGYFGSAVQIGSLEQRLARWEPAPGQAVVMLHAINPWGMAHKRRVTQEGVDQNRNFLAAGARYGGAPEGYRALTHLLNPGTRPGGVEFFLLKTGWQLLTKGLATLKDAIASGQYDYDEGLFFGGHAPTAVYRQLERALPRLLAGAERVIHIDLHTGMGRWTSYVLATDLPADSPRVTELRSTFGDRVQGLSSDGVLYTISGSFGSWLDTLVPGATYDAMLAEFGTFNVVSVLSALRYENRVFHGAHDDADLRARAKAHIVETFCPRSPAWRTTCVREAHGIIDKALTALA